MSNKNNTLNDLEIKDYARKVKRKIPLKIVAESMYKNHGILSYVAKDLGLHPYTIQIYAQKYPVIRQLQAMCKEGTLDLAEHKLIENIEKGKETSLIFYLKTQGKKRGYDQSNNIEINQKSIGICVLPPVENEKSWSNKYSYSSIEPEKTE